MLLKKISINFCYSNKFVYFRGLTNTKLNKNMETVLITGASGGIGKEFAQVFASKGYNLVLVARSEDKLKSIAKELETKYSNKVEVLPQDLSQADSASKIYSEVKNRGIAIDILINNAGFGKFGYFTDLGLEEMTEILNINITTVTQLTSLFLKDMKEGNSGKILNIASTGAVLSLPKLAVYASAKSYILHFTEALHYELKDTNITASVLCPGPTETGFIKRAEAENSNIIKGGMVSPKLVAEIGYKGLMRNKMTITAGFKDKLFMILGTFIPSRRLLTSIAGRLM